MLPLREGTKRTLPPIASDGGDVNIEAHTSDAGELIVEPFPFDTNPIEFSLAASVTDRLTWPDTAAFRRDFRAATRAVLQFTCLG
jgi:hypothetical protein